ncbi:pentapeptide repeat-containing protein [Desulfovibrio sp.]|uniref:pentapeptide repeat-containing protein n=1 Tax=Desulfovibrio sp. TaxID=885 RepID=UPI003D0E31BC
MRQGHSSLQAPWLTTQAWKTGRTLRNSLERWCPGLHWAKPLRTYPFRISSHWRNPSKASPRKTNLCKTRLHKANLHKASLRTANLCQTRLRQTRLRKARLHRPNLCRTFSHWRNPYKVNPYRANPCRLNQLRTNQSWPRHKSRHKPWQPRQRPRPPVSLPPSAIPPPMRGNLSLRFRARLARPYFGRSMRPSRLPHRPQALKNTLIATFPLPVRRYTKI